MSRDRCLSELRSLCTLYGLPSLFVTLAPSDIDNELVLRFTCKANQKGSFDVRIGDLANKDVRSALVTNNPVVQVQGVLLPCSTMCRRPFGAPLWYGTTS